MEGGSEEGREGGREGEREGGREGEGGTEGGREGGRKGGRERMSIERKACGPVYTSSHISQLSHSHMSHIHTVPVSSS